MKLLLAFITIFCSALVAASMIAVTLSTYGLNPHISKAWSVVRAIVWLVAGTLSLWGLSKQK